MVVVVYEVRKNGKASGLFIGGVGWFRSKISVEKLPRWMVSVTLEISEGVTVVVLKISEGEISKENIRG